MSVRVPATSANLGPGFDSLGLALDLYDDVRVRLEDGSAPPVTLSVEGEGAGSVPRDASHLVVRAMYETYAALGLSPPHLTMWCTNRIPHGRGLGSSAAAAAAGVLAACALSGSDVESTEILRLVSGIEGHPDNAAACLLGGLTVAWADGPAVRALRLKTAPEIQASVLVPGDALSTHQARALLPTVVPHADAAHSAGRAALLVAALTVRPDLLLAATEDRLHQAYRSSAMPESLDLVVRLRSAGSAAVLSGAGPSVLVLRRAGDHPLPREAVPSGWEVLTLQVSGVGAEVWPLPA